MKLLLYSMLFCSAVLTAQQTDYVDFKSISADLIISPLEKSVAGEVSYVFDVLKPVDSVFIDAQNMEISKVLYNGDSVTTHYTGKKLWLVAPFQDSENNTLKLSYRANPKKAMYFLGWDNAGKSQVWTQGQGKYTSNWLPSFDDMNEKTTFNLKVKFPKDYIVVSNGKLEAKTALDSLNMWQFSSKSVMSNYLFALACGEYNKKHITSKSGIPIELYYYPEDSLLVEPTYRYSKTMFDFLEEEIGVPFPWENYKQIPVSDFLYAGMENTSATIFSDAYVIDTIGFNDRNYVNVNAHELAHQWFGDFVTATSGTHHWLQEGFATYYALLAEQELFGDSYYKWRLFEYAKELEAQDKSGQSTALLNEKASSTTFYKKGAWTLHALRVEIGDAAFKMAVKNYLTHHKYGNVSTSDFIKEAEQASGKTLDLFFQTWLESETFPMADVVTNEEDDMSYYIKQLNTLECIVKNNADYLLDPTKSYFIKQEIIKANPSLISGELIQKNGVEVRQTIASVLNEIPLELQTVYETFLDDESYQTQEIALYNLWVNFYTRRQFYLDKMDGRIGFRSKNIRQLWLALALSTATYKPENNEVFIKELIGYTGTQYGFETRELAFNYVNALQIYNKEVLSNLIQATHHHNWRFQKYAKSLLESVQKHPEYKVIIDNLLTESGVK
ncbi:M1 family metallopeptidase [Formosa sp. S-31]|uniref:M1 family metallopeptidase n=1 Tax=Formosa sp. S-31 TaxID=2790949 RepID=UPI003EBB644B